MTSLATVSMEAVCCFTTMAPTRRNRTLCHESEERNSVSVFVPHVKSSHQRLNVPAAASGTQTANGAPGVLCLSAQANREVLAFKQSVAAALVSHDAHNPMRPRKNELRRDFSFPTWPSLILLPSWL
jgi:hypothetical protein